MDYASGKSMHTKSLNNDKPYCYHILNEGNYMANNQDREYFMKTNETFQKGQTILYKGDEAKIIDVVPMLTIKLKSKNQIICGDVLLKDVVLK
jgi:hypothetical protein